MVLMRYSTMANVQLNLEFIPPNRGGRLLVFQGCLYKCKIANIGVDHNHVINPLRDDILLMDNADRCGVLLHLE